MRVGWRQREVVVLPGLLVLAAALRLPDLATRGTWDADQGHDMLMLRALVRDGVIPLLGPPTSIGDVHHGALYYFLLAPAAALTGGDSPLAVVALIALAGIAAVGVTWWLARSIGGPVAGLVAGLAMAISPAAIDESTFIWNPNLIALSSAVALAGAWRAWTTRRPGWWLLAAVGTAVTMQCHVLGVTLLPVVGALLVADVRRRRVASERQALIRLGLAGLAIIALSFLPLAIHELTTNFSEVQAALTYLRAGGEPARLDLIPRLLVIASRIISWPLVGLITAGLTAAVVAILGVLGLTIWRFVAAQGEERIAVRWLALGLGWTALALTVISPSLATVVAGLPNDHYHAFADPMVFVAGRDRCRCAVAPRPEARSGSRGDGRAGAAHRDRRDRRRRRPRGPGPRPTSHRRSRRMGASRPQTPHRKGSRRPPAPGPSTCDRCRTSSRPEAYAYPLIRAGRTVDLNASGGDISGSTLVVICDSLFEAAIGAPCGGPAEATAAPPERYGRRWTGSRPRRAGRSRSTDRRRRRRPSGRRQENANAGAPNAGVRCAPKTRAGRADPDRDVSLVAPGLAGRRSRHRPNGVHGCGADSTHRGDVCVRVRVAGRRRILRFDRPRWSSRSAASSGRSGASAPQGSTP